MGWEYVNNYDLSNITFRNNSNIQSVDGLFHNWSNSSLEYAFENCTNLIYTMNINHNVVSINYAYKNCSNLVVYPDISNNTKIKYMSGTFCGCNKITSAPTIPNSVITIDKAFDGCTNLTGDIFIHSNEITNAIDCFNNTSIAKNVYIPFTYQNGDNTATYNAFIEAEYSASIRKNGVLLKDLNEY